jgi:NAD(P)-dependent dehydrogenase (short-subunit alcohol dehydrogenase family)
MTLVALNSPPFGSTLQRVPFLTRTVQPMNHALLIGATGGIGGSLARQLKDNYQLTLVGRNEAKLRELRNALGAQIIPTDVSSELEVQALFEEVSPVDLLVYSAGDIQPELVKLASGDAYRRVLDANLTGLLFTLKYAEAKLQEGSRVYVLGARPELISYRGFGVYAAAKAGVKALVDIAAIEYKRKATFTLVLPKAVNSEFWKNVGKPPADALAPDDVAKAIVESLQGETSSELKVG